MSDKTPKLSSYFKEMINYIRPHAISLRPDRVRNISSLPVFNRTLLTNSFAVFLMPVLIIVLSQSLTACSTMSGNEDEAKVGGSSQNTSQNSNTSNGSDNHLTKQEESATSADSEHETPVAPSKLDGESLFNLLAAEFAGNSGDVETSLEYYQKATEDIEDSRIAARTAYIALYGKRYDEALEALDRWRALDPDASDLTRMYATTYLKLGQPKEAVPYIKEILAKSDGTDIEQAMAVKQLLTNDASIGDGYLVLQRLNDVENNEGATPNKHMLVLQSRYAAQLQRYDESLVLLDQVLEIDPSLHEVQIIKSRILTAQGKQDEAAVLIAGLLEELPDNNNLRLQYARMLVEQGRMNEAIEQYSILYEKLPNDEDIVLSYALLNIEISELDEAVTALEHLIEIDKKVPTANYYLGRIAQNHGEDKQAIAYYLRVSGGEYTYDAQLRIGVLLAALGKPDEGLAKLEALAESQTDWSKRVRAYLAQGEILRSQQRFKEGVEMYSRALQQNRDDINLLYARGLMAEKVDRIDITEADLRKVLSKDPDNANALNALGYTLADRTARYKEAQKYIKRAAELVPDDPAILDSLGWVSYRLGKIDEALKWLSKAFEKVEDAEIAAHYGEVLWYSNQKDKAREVWDKGKQDNADNPVLVETLERIKP